MYSDSSELQDTDQLRAATARLREELAKERDLRMSQAQINGDLNEQLHAAEIGYSTALADLSEELAAEREKVKELKEHLVISEANASHWSRTYSKWCASSEGQQAIRQGERIAELQEQLAAAQATIEQMREALKVITRRANCLDVLEIARTANEALALTIASNPDALHEARALECERLKNRYRENSPCSWWLDEEAAAHRARKRATKEEGK